LALTLPRNTRRISRSRQCLTIVLRVSYKQFTDKNSWSHTFSCTMLYVLCGDISACDEELVGWLFIRHLFLFEYSIFHVMRMCGPKYAT
jgi:hypothetical protein